MRPSHRDTIVMRLQFSDGSQARLALQELGRLPDLSVRVFRGRTIPEDTCFEIEVEGLASSIKEFLRWKDSQPASPAEVA
jgi:hypothetical protein